MLYMSISMYAEYDSHSVYICWSRSVTVCLASGEASVHMCSVNSISPIASLSSRGLLSDLFTCSAHIAQPKGQIEGEN